jgi:hypothetical protein
MTLTPRSPFQWIAVGFKNNSESFLVSKNDEMDDFFFYFSNGTEWIYSFYGHKNPILLSKYKRENDDRNTLSVKIEEWNLLFIEQ